MLLNSRIELKDLKVPEHIQSLVYVRTSFAFCLKNGRRYEATLIRQQHPLSLIMKLENLELRINYSFGWQVNVSNELIAICHSVLDLQSFLIRFMEKPVYFLLKSNVELPLCRWTKSTGILHLLCSLLEGGAKDLLANIIFIYSNTLNAKMIQIKLDHDFVIYKFADIWVLLFEDTLGVSSYDLDFLISLLHPTGIFLSEIYCYSGNMVKSFFLLNQSNEFTRYCEEFGHFGIFGSFQQVERPCISTETLEHIKGELL
eukprot:NODE_222_length_13951_cov_0.396982.p8 type:complete len:258 gc:universal NODE_222_length_13951_cov_0.396982:12899-12126(-)